MTADMSSWERLGELLIARRVQLGWTRRAAFARDKGLPNDRILFDMERAKRTNYDPSTYAVIEQTYEWETGSVRRVLSGGEPIVTAEGPSGAPSLSVVPSIVETSRVEEVNRVLAAIYDDPDLDEQAKAHFLNQYEILRDFSIMRRQAGTGEPPRLPYVAHGQPVEPISDDEEKRLEGLAREVRRRADEEEGRT